MIPCQYAPDTEDVSEWATALSGPRPESIGPRRRILRNWLQQAWGTHFDPAQGAMWDLALTLALPYKLCTDVLWPILVWFWDLHQILFDPDHSMRENWAALTALPGQIFALLGRVEERPERALTGDEVEWEGFLGPELERDFEGLRYGPLEDGRGGNVIRIVELLPGKGLEGIECRLRHIVLALPDELEIKRAFNIQELSPGDASRDQEQDIHVSYEALSYCWGDNTVKTPIVCNDARLDITRNLKSALQHLRDAVNTRALWIDAICINQDDVAERTQQVGCMREIYQQAERVVVWLGESNDDDCSAAALSLCARVALIAAANRDEMAIERLNYRTITSPRRPGYAWVSSEAHEAAAALLGEDGSRQVLRSGGRRAGGDGDAVDRAEMWALQDLLERPWFTRMWIAQEIGVAKEALLVCGETAMDWSLFDLGYTLTVLTGEARQYLDKDVVGNGMGRLVILRRILAGRDDLTPREQKLLTLPVLLNTFRKHKATDARDKIFALLGFTSTDLDAVNLRPDYHSSVEDVYKAAARALMKSSQDLYILSIPRGNTDLSRKLPSWVPDWSDTAPQPVMFSRYSEATDNLSPVPLPTYCASNGTRLRAHSTPEDANTLHLSGYAIDKIVHLSDVYTPATPIPLSQMPGPDPLIFPWAAWLAALHTLTSHAHSLAVLYSWRTQALHPPRPTPSPSPSRPHLLAQYQRVLCADWTPDGPRAAAADFRTWDRQFRPAAVLHALGVYRLWPRASDVAAWLGAAAYWVLRGTDGAFASAMECAALRRLAWTGGGWLGLVPAGARVGDAVVLVEGGDVPLVLRRVGDGGAGMAGAWVLVGERYIDGVMYSEAWDGARCRGIELM